MKIANPHDIAKASAEAFLKILEASGEDSQTVVGRKFLTDLSDETRKKVVSRTIQAAMEGKLYIPVTDLQLDEAWLQSLGFEIIHAKKRFAYESWLKDSLEKDADELLVRADALLSSCSLLRYIEDSEFHHRNPILSLMETMWRQKQISSDLDLDSLIDRINSYPKVNGSLSVEYVSMLQIIYTLFLRGKAVQKEYESVSWLNSAIPEDVQFCQILSWREADQKIGNEILFSARTAKWLSTHWMELCDCLNEHFDEAPKDGRFNVDLRMSFDEGEWTIEKYDEGYYSKSVIACSPLLLIDHLDMAGFSAQLVQWNDEAHETFPSESDLNTPLSNDFDHAYYLRVGWSRENF